MPIINMIALLVTICCVISCCVFISRYESWGFWQRAISIILLLLSIIALTGAIIEMDYSYYCDSCIRRY